MRESSQHNGVLGTMSNETTLSAPLSINISQSLCPTNPVPPVTTYLPPFLVFPMFFAASTWAGLSKGETSILYLFFFFFFSIAVSILLLLFVVKGFLSLCVCVNERIAMSYKYLMALSHTDVDGDDVYDFDGADAQETIRQSATAPSAKQYRTVPKDKTLAIESKIDEFGIISGLDWVESFLVDGGKVPAGVNPNDDIKREDEFYALAKAAAENAKKLLKEHKVSIQRPGDYFAEMLKTDDHMERVREKMLNEEKKIETQEKARKQRENKKFGKKVQQEVLHERARHKRATLELAARRGKDLLQNEGADFGVEAISGASLRNKKSAKRQARDERFGHGGKKKHAKSNTKESTDDMSGFPGRRMKQGFGAQGNKKKGNPKRLGKSKRQKMKNKQ
eukprot:m.69885 g.69885  ORF g.69885 m.69885 type:complete len:393 (+) comp11649_c0_seq2:1155-2333(+)